MYHMSHFSTRVPDCQRNTPQLAASHHIPRRNYFAYFSIIVLNILALAFSLSSANIAVGSTGVVAYYDCKGNANDSSGNSNHGTASNVTYVPDRMNIANSACSFNGSNSSIKVPRTNLFEGKNLTITAWVRWDGGKTSVSSTSGITHYYYNVISNYNGNLPPAQQHYTLAALLDNKTTEAPFTFTYRGLGDTALRGVLDNGTNKVLLNDGKWHQLTAIFRGGNQAEVYVDGQYKAFNRSNIAASISPEGDLYIGYFHGAPPNTKNWLGAIDDIALLNYAMSSQEVTQLYRTISIGNTTFVPDTNFPISSTDTVNKKIFTVVKDGTATMVVEEKADGSFGVKLPDTTVTTTRASERDGTRPDEDYSTMEATFMTDGTVKVADSQYPTANASVKGGDYTITDTQANVTGTLTANNILTVKDAQNPDITASIDTKGTQGFSFTDANHPGVVLTSDLQGNFVGTDASSPTTVVQVSRTTGLATATDSQFPGIVMKTNGTGGIEIVDASSPTTTVTLNSDGTHTVTDSEFPTVKAIVDSEMNMQVTDSENPDIMLGVSGTGGYTFTDLKDGTCVTSALGARWSLKKAFKKVVSVVKKIFKPVVNIIKKVVPVVVKVFKPVINVVSSIFGKFAKILPKIGGFVGKWFKGGFFAKVGCLLKCYLLPGLKAFLGTAGAFLGPLAVVAAIGGTVALVSYAVVNFIKKRKQAEAEQQVEVIEETPAPTPPPDPAVEDLNADFGGNVPVDNVVNVPPVATVNENLANNAATVGEQRRAVREGERIDCPVQPLAELTRFAAQSTQQTVKLEWALAGELSVLHFNVLRAEIVSGVASEMVKINSQPVDNYEEGRGEVIFTFEDTQATSAHTYRYMVEGINPTNDASVLKSATTDVTVGSENGQVELPTANSITLQSGDTAIVATDSGVKLLSNLPAASTAEDIQVTVGSALTEDGQPSVINASVAVNGDTILTDPLDNTSEPLTVNKDGEVAISDGNTLVTFKSDGGFVGVDADDPTQQVVMTPDGQVTSVDSADPSVAVTVNTDGSFTGKDVISGTEVTLTKQGQQIVTHPEYPGVQAVVNPDNTLAVTDTSDPDAAGAMAIFDTTTGNFQVVNQIDGSCLDDSSSQRKGFLKKVAGFVSKAAGFVAKVANKVVSITAKIQKVVGKVNKVASFIIKKAPTIHKWATKLYKWACKTCHPLIAGISQFVANNTAPDSKFLKLLGKVPNVIDKLNSVSTKSSKVAEIAQKVSGWFARWKSGRNLREGERATSTCDTWEPIPPKPPLPAISYTLWGNLLNNSGNTLSGTTIKVGELSATPDAQGYWEIKGLTEGEHEVTAEKVGLIFMPQTVELGSQEKVEVKFTPITDSKLKVSVNPRAPNQGDDIAYTVDIFNGSAQAMSATLKDLLPTGTLLNLTASEGVTCAANDATFECQIDTLAAGGKAQVSFVISNLNATPLTNKVTLTSPQFSTAATATTVTKIRPYLSASCKTKPSPAVMFGNLAYDCSVLLSEKAPDAEVTDVVFNLSLPKGIITTQLPATCTANDGIISCALGTLARGAPVKLDTIQASLGELMLLQLSTEIKVTGANYPETKDVVRTNILLGDAKVDGIILLDTTGSMQDEMDAMTQAVEKIGIKPDTYIALVSFRDDVKLEVLTSDRDELVKALKKLKADGGGECPEASAEALNLALDHIKPNGIIIFASDAPPYPGTDIEKLKARIVEKQANFVPILTKSDCAPNQLSHPQQ